VAIYIYVWLIFIRLLINEISIVLLLKLKWNFIHYSQYSDTPIDTYLLAKTPSHHILFFLIIQILFTILLLIKTNLTLAKRYLMSEFEFYGMVFVLLISSYNTSTYFLFEIDNIYYLFFLLLIQFQRGYFTRVPVNEQ